MESQPTTSKSKNNKRQNKIVALVVAGLLILGVALYLGLSQGKSTTGISTASNRVAKVQITADGFVPAAIQINAGDSVQWVNTDTSAHQVATDPYPTEDGLPGFVSKTPQLKGQSYQYNFKNTGTYTYHDHLKSSLQGSVIVK